MKPTDATRATAQALPDLGDALDVLNRAWSQVELINMAAEAGAISGEAGNAIAWGCISVQELLKQVKGHLEPCVQSLAKGWTPSHHEAGEPNLLEMIEAYQATIDKINQTDGDTPEEDVAQLLDAALCIIGYHPLSKDEERRKAEFLREYTAGTLLTEQEQRALVASMMSEGGEA